VQYNPLATQCKLLAEQKLLAGRQSIFLQGLQKSFSTIVYLSSNKEDSTAGLALV